MTDYDYGCADYVQLTGSEGKNGANSINGYSLAVSPDANWPGTSADPSKTRVDPDKMEEIATKIDHMIDTLRNSNVISDVTSSNSSARYGPDSWAAARYLREASNSATGLVTNFTNQLITNLTAASTAIRSATGSYKGSESANTQTANNQQSAANF